MLGPKDAIDSRANIPGAAPWNIYAADCEQARRLCGGHGNWCRSDRLFAETQMNSVLSEILETGTTRTASGTSTIKVHSSISSSEGQFLQELVRRVDPTTSLEVGLAYGISALFVCD